MGMFSDYERVGKGITKDPDQKLPLFKFLDIFFSHFSKLVMANFIFIIALLPFAAIMFLEYLDIGNLAFYVILVLMGAVVGPAICGFTKVLRNISCRRPVFIWNDFWKAARTNFKQGAVMGIIDMLAVVAMSFAFPMYYTMGEQNSFFKLPFAICLVCSFLFVMMHFYIYLMIVSTTLSLWQILKNSLYLTAIEIKTSIINLITTVILLLSFWVLSPWSIFSIVILPAFLGVLYCFNCFPAIRKHVIKPYYDERGEEMPDLSYTQSTEEAVFVDTPETEIPQEPPKKQKKGRRIK